MLRYINIYALCMLRQILIIVSVTTDVVLDLANQPVIITSSHPGQNGRYLTDDIIICILGNEKVLYFDKKKSRKFVLEGPIDNNKASI